MFLRSAVLPLTELASNSSSSDGGFWSKAAFAVGSAVIVGACSYAVAVLLARRNPHKQLSWDSTTDRGLLAVSSEIRDNVMILYKGKNIDNLVAVKCRVANTGNVVVKNQQLRFAFPGGQGFSKAISLLPQNVNCTLLY